MSAGSAKAAPLSLVDAEELLRLTLEHVSDAVFITDGTGNFLFVGPNVEIVFGHSRAEVVKMGRIDALLGHPRFSPDALERSGELREVEVTISRNDGAARNLLVTVKRVSVRGRTVVYICRDVTELKRLDQAARDSAAPLANLFEELPVAAMIASMVDERILQVNKGFTRLFGWEREEAIGKKTFELGAWGNLNPSTRTLDAEQREGAGEFVFDYRSKAGREGVAEAHGTSLDFDGEPCSLTVFRDITHQTLADTALRQSEARFRAAFQAGPGTSMLSRIEDGRVVEVNELFLKETGYSRAEVIGRTTLEIGVWVDSDERERFVAALREHGQVVRFPVHLRNKSGDVRLIETTARFIELGGQRYLFSVGSDITERRAAEEALQRQTDRLGLLYDVVAGLLRTDTLENVAKTVLKRVRHMFQSDRASLLVFETGGRPTFLAVDARSGIPATSLAGYPADEFFWPEEFYRGETVITGNLEELEDPTIVQRVLLEEGIRCYVRVPLMVEETVIGSLNMGASSAEAFTPERLAMAREVADSMAVAVRHSQLRSDASDVNLRLRALSSQLLDTQEAERRHLAHELHDEVGQTLALVKKCLMSARTKPESAALIPGLDMYIDHVGETITKVRDLSLKLRPSVLDDMGLVPALQWLADRLGQQGGVPVAVSGEEHGERLPRSLEIAGFRMAQEALTNAIKHAAAKSVQVEVQRTRNEVFLAVSDDGVGFDVRSALENAKAGSSLGLLGMEERVRLAGGFYRIVSELGKGTRVEARFPA